MVIKKQVDRLLLAVLELVKNRLSIKLLRCGYGVRIIETDLHAIIETVNIFCYTHMFSVTTKRICKHCSTHLDGFINGKSKQFVIGSEPD